MLKYTKFTLFNRGKLSVNIKWANLKKKMFSSNKLIHKRYLSKKYFNNKVFLKRQRMYDLKIQEHFIENMLNKN